MSDDLKFPAPYFGGKARVAADVWAALGQPKAYLEPFFGSGAVLLARKGWTAGVHTETVCDLDGHVANVWRALQFAPDETARWCDWPVSHVDLMARKKELIKNEGRLVEGMVADPKWNDPVMAGYWIWAVSCWIGSGLTRPGQIPHVSDAGMGINAVGQIPHVGHAGMGINAVGKIPHVGHAGKGINAVGKRPHVSNAGMAVTDPYNTNLWTWFRKLSERMRYVRVVCGDWTRVCGGDWQDKIGDVGLFMDPPYGTEANRDEDIYGKDSLTVAGDVREWCRERGDRPTYRIVLAGYFEEHESLLSEGWRVKTWSARGGYSSTARSAKPTQGQLNRHKEALFYSPHCLDQEGMLF
jgi:DNA adenine methylase